MQPPPASPETREETVGLVPVPDAEVPGAVWLHQWQYSDAFFPNHDIISCEGFQFP